MKCKYCPGSARKIAESIWEEKWICGRCRRTMIIPRPQPPRGNTFLCYNHQGKANALVSALLGSNNWQEDVTERYRRRVKFVLTDSDVLGRRTQLHKMKEMGINLFFVYPHAARPNMANDHYGTWPHTTAQFVVNEYHAEVLRGYGYSKPLEGIGWGLCPICPFQAKAAARRVLFAPIHPRNAPIDRKVNAEAFERLYKLAQAGEISLQVRYIGALAENGLQRVAGVEYLPGHMDGSFKEIDEADVLIGHQTVAWIAVARGTPTIMMAEDMPTHYRRHDQDYEFTKSWNKVKRLFQYPLDLLEENDTMALLNRAARSDLEIQDWRRRMIGDPFDPARFVGIVESYL